MEFIITNTAVILIYLTLTKRNKHTMKLQTRLQLQQTSSIYLGEL